MTLPLIAFFSFSSFLFGQTASSIQPIRPNTAELKKFLELSDEQLAQLKQIQANRLAMTEAAYRDVSTKQKQLNELLAGGSTDALAIGNLSIEIRRLRTQTITPNADPAQSLAVLTSAQKTKLAELQKALTFRQAADQAAALHLIEYPRTVVIIPK